GKWRKRAHQQFWRRHFLNTLVKQSKNRFELELLEPRVLLSADALAVAALAGAHNSHQQFGLAHEELLAGQGTLQQTLACNPAGQVANIFDGICGQAIASTQGVSREQPVAQPDDHGRKDSSEKGAVAESSLNQNSHTAVQAKTETRTSGSGSAAAKIS